MPRKRWPMLVTAGIVLSLTLSAFAFSGNAANGKTIFMRKGLDGKACMSCHPKGLNTSETYKGKDIPDLTAKQLRPNKLESKTVKFLKVQGMTLSPAELADLLTFVEGLPTKGFGPVPPAWRAYVQEKTGQ